MAEEKMCVVPLTMLSMFLFQLVSMVHHRGISLDEKPVECPLMKNGGK